MLAGNISLKCERTFFFYMDPLTNDGFPGAISKFPTSAPLWGPTTEHLAICTLAWVG